MRLIAGSLVVALIAILGLSAPVRAQDEPPPLEDVTLRGRVLRADGKPLANTPVRVDAINDSGFAILGFFFTAGLSTISCFTGPNELCPIPNSKRFNASTDANGGYSFTFRNAHRRGEQTNTDYVLSIAAPARSGGDRIAVASYELELLDAVHDAPDLVMWDPAIKVTARTRGYAFSYDRRANSKNGYGVMVGDQRLNVELGDDETIDARAIEDATVHFVPNAAKDVTSAGTIYHQRFVAAPVPLKGTLVPLSRRAPCTATRSDGPRVVSHCGYTDGDLISAAVADPNPCEYTPDGKAVVTEDPASGQPVACQPPINSVTIDLGAVKDVGEVRGRCGCAVTASSDGASWRTLPASGRLGSSQPLRYVRFTGASLASVPEMSVWPPWPDGVAATPLAPGASPSSSAAGGPSSGADADRDNPPWLLGAIALVALIAVAHQTLNRLSPESRRAGRTPGN